ncbi:amino acid permease [Nonomuraea basaltis]|nr:amino acid permease [Nonomuraea basaltis]
MIALGAAIGTGLFYGSAEAITTAGPSVLLVFAIGGVAIFWIVRALGEMSVEDPASGAFSHHAHRNWSSRAGFVSGWNYWFTCVAVAMVELSVVGKFVNYWFPDIPGYLSAAFFLVTITAVNMVGVRVYGEFEFWFAIIKVAAVAAMIVLGTMIVVLGINNNSNLIDPSFAHLVDDGGFFPHGISGGLQALVIVMFAFSGTELVAVTAGEAEDPRRTLPRAINQVVVRILLFYILALAIIMAVVPWSRIDGRTSPFVQIFEMVGVRGAAHILNFVVLTAVLSVYNSTLYGSGRMLHSLTRQGNAPALFGKVTSRGVPLAGVLASSAVTAVAVAVVFLWPDFAFTYLLAIATIAAVINWTMIIVTHQKFRRRIGPEAVANLTFRMPGAPVTGWIALAFLALIVALMAASSGFHVAVIAGPLWIAGLLIAYEIKVRFCNPSVESRAPV